MNTLGAFILNPNLNAIELQDALNERLNKANSLAQFVLVEDIAEHLNQAVHHYLWALSQLIEEACEINQRMAVK